MVQFAVQQRNIPSGTPQDAQALLVAIQRLEAGGSGGVSPIQEFLAAVAGNPLGPSLAGLSLPEIKARLTQLASAGRGRELRTRVAQPPSRPTPPSTGGLTGGGSSAGWMPSREFPPYGPTTAVPPNLSARLPGIMPQISAPQLAARRARLQQMLGGSAALAGIKSVIGGI